MITVEVKHRDGTIIGSSKWNDRVEAERFAAQLRSQYSKFYTIIVR